MFHIIFNRFYLKSLQLRCPCCTSSNEAILYYYSTIERERERENQLNQAIYINNRSPYNSNTKQGLTTSATILMNRDPEKGKKKKKCFKRKFGIKTSMDKLKR
jgi:hypothetical protein